MEDRNAASRSGRECCDFILKCCPKKTSRDSSAKNGIEGGVDAGDTDSGFPQAGVPLCTAIFQVARKLRSNFSCGQTEESIGVGLTAKSQGKQEGLFLNRKERKERKGRNWDLISLHCYPESDLNHRGTEAQRSFKMHHDLS